MKKLTVLLLLSAAFLSTRAQQVDGVVQEGEFGVTLGAAHYFGDLNTNAALNRPKPAIGVFFRKLCLYWFFKEYVII